MNKNPESKDYEHLISHTSFFFKITHVFNSRCTKQLPFPSRKKKIKNKRVNIMKPPENEEQLGIAWSSNYSAMYIPSLKSDTCMLDNNFH